MKYIDANTLLEHLAEAIEAWDEMDKDRYPVSFGMSVAFKNIFEYAKEHSTAEVVEVRHGRWIRQAPNKDYLEALHKEGVALGMGVHSIYWNCSECGGWGGLYHKYCPNCGAKMDGKVTE